MSNQKEKKDLKTEMFEWVREIGIAVLIALFITKFMFTHIVVPTPSMMPTIQCDDHLMVNKIPMYYRNPERGEIVVFHGADKELIKRVIGLPGEEIDIRDGHVYIDGEILEEEYLSEDVLTKAAGNLSYPYEIPEDNYFVMGDNRTNSQDSRYIGTVEREQIHAVANLRIWPLNSIGNIN